MRKTKKKKTTNIILTLNSEKFRILPLRSGKILLCLFSSPVFYLKTVFIYLRETGKNMWGQGGKSRLPAEWDSGGLLRSIPGS